MKKIIGAHIFNTSILFFLTSFIGLLGVGVVIVMPVVFLTEGLKDFSFTVLLGFLLIMAMGGGVSYFYLLLAWDFIRFLLLQLWGNTATAQITKHNYRIQTHKGSKGGTYHTHIYEGSLVFTTHKNQTQELAFLVKDPGKEREDIKHSSSALEVLYLPRFPHIACIAWQGATKYRKQFKGNAWMLVLWLGGFAILSYDTYSAAPLFHEMVLPLFLVFATLFYWILVWIVMSILRERTL